MQATAALLGGALGVLALLALTWLCLVGRVEHELPLSRMRGGSVAHLRNVAVPPAWWPGGASVELRENGRPLGPRVENAHAVHRSGAGAFALSTTGGAVGSHRATVHFSASDGSSPRTNGRRYTIRYPRRELPASAVLLLLSWGVFVTWLVRLHRRSERSLAPDAVAWSVLIVGVVYSLFAAQAWLVAHSGPWLFAVVAAGLAPCLARVTTGRWVVPMWLLWLVGLLLWAGCSLLNRVGYASPRVLAGMLVACGGGLVLYFGLRGALVRTGAPGSGLLVAVFAWSASLSLARDAGFDLAGAMVALSPGRPESELLFNPWTTKFMSHWLLVTAACALVASGRVRPQRRGTLLFVSLLGLTTLGLNGSKAGAVVLVAALVVGGIAWRWPAATRRLVIYGLLAVILCAPLWAAVPWAMRGRSMSGLSSGSLEVIEADARPAIWELSRRLIALHPLGGWGIGASTRLPARHISIREAFGAAEGKISPRVSRQPALPGGHPHDAALLVWLDLGLIGALLVAGLVWSIGRAIATMEEERTTHAALLGLLTVDACFLAFNYPAWKPEIQSILWMSTVLAASALPCPGVSRLAVRQSGLAIALVLALGGGLLTQGGLSRWLVPEEFPLGSVTPRSPDRPIPGETARNDLPERLGTPRLRPME